MLIDHGGYTQAELVTRETRWVAKNSYSGQKQPQETATRAITMISDLFHLQLESVFDLRFVIIEGGVQND